jgi:haloalkane dehalogenase
MYKSLLCIGLVLSLTGCASAPDSKANYDRYVAQFEIAQPSKNRTVKRKDGKVISAREFGESHRGKRPSMVLMHGFPDNQHLYDLVIPALAKNHHVISFDFLGWGNSEKPVDHRYDVASQRADLNAIIDELKLTDVVLVVHDLSGHAENQQIREIGSYHFWCGRPLSKQGCRRIFRAPVLQ